MPPKLGERLSAELNPEPIHCVECGRELVDLEPGGSPPTRCEDCLPDTGPGSAFADRLSINLHELRARAGLSPTELGNRAAMHVSAVSGIEGDSAHELRLTTALRLMHPLGASIDQLTERIYWNPGQVVRNSQHPPKERLSGFFLVLSSNVPVFEPVPPREPVTTREEAAAIFGVNVRNARERRHLTQQALGRAAGLSKAGLSLIERGVRETSLQTLFALARSLEVAPEPLLEGIAWKPERPPCEGSRARRPGAASTMRSAASGMKTRPRGRSPRPWGLHRGPSRPRSTGSGSVASRFDIGVGRRERFTNGRAVAALPVRHRAPMRIRRSRRPSSYPASTAPPTRRSPLGSVPTSHFAARKPGCP